MPIIQFSQKELKRGEIVDPAWYRVKIESIETKTSSKGDSTNYVMEGLILFDGDTGETKFSDIPLTWNFNSKAPGFMVGFFQALGYTIEADKRYELEAAAGESIDIFVENGTYEGRVVNRVNHKYRKPNSEVVAA
jgi:hypothetical protein